MLQLSVWLCLILFGLFDSDLVRSQGAGPKAVEVRTQLTETVWVDRVDAAVADGLVNDQSCVLEHPEVLRDSRPADRKALGELANCVCPFGKPLKDGAPGAIAEGGPCGKVVSRHAQ
jgi:hypothetical protein